MKGSLYANPTFIRKNIRTPTVILIRPMVAYDQHRLYFNNISIKWQHKDIVNCTYSFVYKVLLILTDDYKVYVYSQNLQMITHLNNWQPKYIVGFRLLEEINMILLIGTEEVEAVKINILTNIKKTKFLSSMKFNIKRLAHLEVDAASKLKWNKGFGYNIKEDLLYVWSLLDIHFFSLQKLTIRTKIVNLTKKQNSITTVYFNSNYKYTITGMLNGDIKVWRLPISSLYSHKQILIHNFSYHSRQVEEIINGNDQKTIITYAQDLYVCFMSIETFELLRIFNFSGQYTKIFLYDHMKAYAIKDSYLGQLNFGKNLQFIADLTGSPIFHDCLPHCNGTAKHQKLQLTLGSNLGYELTLSDIQNCVDLNKIQIKHIYPPLKSKNITQILSCPYYSDTYFMIVQDGDIYRARLQGTTGKIDHHYVISKSVDSEKHCLHQSPSAIAFFCFVPPSIDTQIIQKTVDKQFKIAYKFELLNKLKLLAIGCNRGSIIFISIDDMDNIYARVSYHRESIINFQEVINKKTGNQWMISVCLQKFAKIVNFKQNKANCVYSIFLGQIYSNMHAFQENICIIFQKGVFQVCKFEHAQEQPKIIINKESINHEEDIVSFDYRSDLGLIITGAKDNRIKIWTNTKILVYQVILEDNLEYCVWSTHMHILIVQNHKLYGLRNMPLVIKADQVDKLNQQFVQYYKYEDQIVLSKYVEQSLARNKEKYFIVRSVKKKQFHSLNQSPVRSSQKKQRKLLSPIRPDKSSLNNSAIFDIKTPVKNKLKRVSMKTQGSQTQKNKLDSDLTALKKHLQELSNIKKQTNESLLPKIKPKNQDIFVQFMRQKLLNKKLLTRRDITLNRIIMKNLIKDHLGNDSEVIKNFKLE